MKKPALNSTQLNSILVQSKMFPHRDVVDRMMVDVANQGFYLGRAKELLFHLEHSPLSEKDRTRLVIHIIKVMTIYLAYAIKEGYATSPSKSS